MRITASLRRWAPPPPTLTEIDRNRIVVTALLAWTGDTDSERRRAATVLLDDLLQRHELDAEDRRLLGDLLRRL